MKNTEYTFPEAPSFTPTFVQIPWLNATPIDYALIKWHP